jgi:hypothetical protein
MPTRIAICAPATPITPEDVARTQAIAAAFPDAELHFHPQCFAVDGHFAGPDAVRLAAFLDCANDPAFDAVWFARGGYGSNRIAGRRWGNSRWRRGTRLTLAIRIWAICWPGFTARRSVAPRMGRWLAMAAALEARKPCAGLWAG